MRTVYTGELPKDLQELNELLEADWRRGFSSGTGYTLKLKEAFPEEPLDNTKVFVNYLRYSGELPRKT